MIRVGTIKSGGGRLADLHAFTKRSINAEPADVVMGASRVTRIKPRCDLDMPDAKIAPLPGARKWYTAYPLCKNSIYNLNDSPCLVFERSWLYVAPSSLTAEPRAIPHAQSPKLNPRQTKGPVASWAEGKTV